MAGAGEMIGSKPVYVWHPEMLKRDPGDRVGNRVVVDRWGTTFCRVFLAKDHFHNGERMPGARAWTARPEELHAPDAWVAAGNEMPK